MMAHYTVKRIVANRTTKYKNYLETVVLLQPVSYMYMCICQSYTFTASVSHAINLYTNISKRKGLIAHMVGALNTIGSQAY